MTGEPDLEHERREAAQLLLGDPRYAALLVGHTVREIVEHAAVVAKTLREYHAEQAARHVSFDGGARQPEPPPPPTHDQTVVDLLSKHPRGDGTGWGRW